MSDPPKQKHLGIMALFFVLIAGLALSSCSPSAPARLAQPDASGPTLDVPMFSIALELSPAAEKLFQRNGESIEVLAMFDGDALPGQGTFNAPMRDVVLGSSTKVADIKHEVKFDDAKIPLREWDKLSDKNYFVTINTFSARKIEKDNLLECMDPISVKINDIKGKTTKVRCRLIGEQPSGSEDVATQAKRKLGGR